MPTPHSSARRTGIRDARVTQRNPPTVTQDHWVYLCYDTTDRLLYVGVTSRGFARFTNEHSKYSGWWGDVARIDVRHLPTRDAALDLEMALIMELDPLHNTVHVTSRAYRIPKGSPPTHWLTFDALVDWLDTEPAWLRVKIAQGMPHVLLAGAMRFQAAEVRSWLTR